MSPDSELARQGGPASAPAGPRPLEACPACSQGPLRRFYEVTDIPVQSCVLLSTEREALAYPRGDLSLACCERCGFILNTKFRQELQVGSGGYEASQAFSPRFNEFLRAQCENLIEHLGIRNRRVIEIGCGSGDFLKLLCELGNNTGVGFDPEYRGPASDGRVSFIQDVFSEKHFGTPADLIACRHTLEHIQEVAAFMKMVRAACAEREVLLFFEVPDVYRILTDQAFWDVYYEHCSYFSFGSLARLFRLTGFDILDLNTVYGDQYLIVTATPATGALGTGPPEAGRRFDREDDVRLVAEASRTFGEKVNDLLEDWRQRLSRLREAKKRVALWGSGSKAAGFLATLGVREQIPYVVDINPRKQDMYQAGTGQRIVAPETLIEYRPDFVVVMNPIYLEEIRAKLQSLGLDPELASLP